MFHIIFSPTHRFAQLKEKPDWLAPFILALILPLFIGTLSVIILPRQTLINATENRINRVKGFIEKQVETGKMPSDQRDAAIERIEKTAQVELDLYERASKINLFFRFLVRSLPATIWSALQLLIWTTVLNLLLPLLGAGSSFGRLWAITTNSALVRIPAAVFRVLLILSTNKITATTSLLLLAPSAPLYLKGVLACIDIFTLWELGLTSLGLKVIFNLDLKRTSALVFGLWFIYVLILAGLSTLSGGLAFPD
ncbi:MAG: YIP1 family protein [candidate division WOR-3 bacterium]